MKRSVPGALRGLSSKTVKNRLRSSPSARNCAKKTLPVACLQCTVRIFCSALPRIAIRSLDSFKACLSRGQARFSGKLARTSVVFVRLERLEQNLVLQVCRFLKVGSRKACDLRGAAEGWIWSPVSIAVGGVHFEGLTVTAAPALDDHHVGTLGQSGGMPVIRRGSRWQP